MIDTPSSAPVPDRADGTVRIARQCDAAESFLTDIDSARKTGILRALERAIRQSADLRDSTGHLVRDLPETLRRESATRIVRSVRLQRELATAAELLMVNLRESLFVLIRTLRRPQPPKHSLAMVCEHLSDVVGAPARYSPPGRDEATAAIGDSEGSRTAEETAVAIAGSGGNLGHLHIVVDAASPLCPLTTAYLNTVAHMVGLALDGALHEESLAHQIDRLESLLARTRAAASTHGVADESWDDLTPREREILAFLRRGASNTVIAEHLYVSVETVKTHVRNILRKLGSTSRTELIVPASGPRS